MHFLVFFLLSFVVIVLQTTLLPEMFNFLALYDLLIPIVIYFSMYRPFYQGLSIVLPVALMMDMLSGAPAGIYLITYTWLFLAFRQTWRFLDLNNNYLFPVLAVTGVLFQQFVFWVLFVLQSGQITFSAQTVRIVFLQNVWAIITTPLVYLFLRFLFRVVDQLVDNRTYENGRAN